MDFTDVRPRCEYAILGVQRSGLGLVERPSVRGSDMKFKKLMRLQADNLVYRTITAFEAPSAVVEAHHDGGFVTPTTFPVFKIDKRRLLPRFMRLITTWGAFHEEMSSRCTGTVLRRKTLSVAAFNSIPVDLPPVPEQRRIVDLIAAVDAARDASARDLAAITALQAQLRERPLQGTRVRIGDVLTALESGTSTRPVDGAGERVQLLTLAAIRPGVFVPSQVKDVGPARLPEKARLRSGDLLITRSNTPDRVGYVALATDVRPRTFIPDLVWRLVPDHRHASSEFLAEYLSSPSMREKITATATGTSPSMRKINKATFSALTLPLPSLADQEGYLDPLRGLRQARAAQEGVLRRLQDVRSHLLTALLSGEHEIPATYDELLAG